MESKLFKKYLTKKNITKHGTLTKFLKSAAGKKLSVAVKKELKTTRKYFEKYIAGEVENMAALQYLIMQKKDYFGELGEQRTAISYCRLLLHISPDKELSQNDAQEFYKRLKTRQREYEPLSLKTLERIEEDMRCELFGRTVEWFKEEEINEVFAFLESKCRVIVGFLGLFRSIILGVAKEQNLDGYLVTEFTREIYRTPANVLSIAAVVGGRHICLRHESCRLIFENKWHGFFKQDDFERELAAVTEFGLLGEGFKQKALYAYGCTNTNELETKKKLFIQEMLEGLLWHEIGHGIVLNSLLLPDDSAFGEALAVLGCNIVAVLKEFIADWAPVRPEGLDYRRLEKIAKKQNKNHVFILKEDLRKYLDPEEFDQLKAAYLHETQFPLKVEHIKGPLRHFINLALSSKAGRKKAARLLYVYMSDNWFLGNTENFSNHTDIMLSAMLPYLKKDDFDFEKWNLDLPNKFQEVLARYTALVQALEVKVINSTFLYQGEMLAFKEYAKFIKEKIHRQESGLSEDMIEFLVPFYAEIIEHLAETNPELLNYINEELRQANEAFHLWQMEWLTGKRQNFSPLLLRNHLVSQLKRFDFEVKNIRA